MTEGKLASQIVPRRVKELRGARGRMHQADLAARLTKIGGIGWSQAQLSKLESGARRVTIDDVLLLAVALDVSPLALIAVEPVRVTNELILDPYDVWLWARGYKPLAGQDEWAYFAALPEEDRSKVDLTALLGTALSAEHARREGGETDAG